MILSYLSLACACFIPRLLLHDVFHGLLWLSVTVSVWRLTNDASVTICVTIDCYCWPVSVAFTLCVSFHCCVSQCVLLFHSCFIAHTHSMCLFFHCVLHVVSHFSYRFTLTACVFFFTVFTYIASHFSQVCNVYFFTLFHTLCAYFFTLCVQCTFSLCFTLFVSLLFHSVSHSSCIYFFFKPCFTLFMSTFHSVSHCASLPFHSVSSCVSLSCFQRLGGPVEWWQNKHVLWNT